MSASSTPAQASPAVVTTSTPPNHDADSGPRVVTPEEAHRLKLEEKLEQLLQSLLEVGICTSNVEASALEGARLPNGEVWGAGGLLGTKINKAIGHMSEVYATNKQQPRPVPIPIEVIDHIDDGHNPDRWLKNFVDCVAHENMYAHGIMASYSEYQTELAEELHKAFPDVKFDHPSSVC